MLGVESPWLYSQERRNGRNTKQHNTSQYKNTYITLLSIISSPWLLQPDKINAMSVGIAANLPSPCDSELSAPYNGLGQGRQKLR